MQVFRCPRRAVQIITVGVGGDPTVWGERTTGIGQNPGYVDRTVRC